MNFFTPCTPVSVSTHLFSLLVSLSFPFPLFRPLSSRYLFIYFFISPIPSLLLSIPPLPFLLSLSLPPSSFFLSSLFSSYSLSLYFSPSPLSHEDNAHYNTHPIMHITPFKMERPKVYQRYPRIQPMYYKAILSETKKH